MAVKVGKVFNRNILLAKGSSLYSNSIEVIDEDGNITGSVTTDSISVSGNTTLGGAVITSGITATSGAGAVPITGTLHEVTTTGTGDALTLANGTAGQRLSIVYVAEGAGGDTAVITPTTLAGGTTITLNALGDSVDLVYSSTGGRYVLGLGGTAAVA